MCLCYFYFASVERDEFLRFSSTNTKHDKFSSLNGDVCLKHMLKEKPLNNRADNKQPVKRGEVEKERKGKGEEKSVLRGHSGKHNGGLLFHSKSSESDERRDDRRDDRRGSTGSGLLSVGGCGWHYTLCLCVCESVRL